MLFLYLILGAIELRPYFVSDLPSKNSEKVDYIIITSDKLKYAFEPFRKHKKEKGINCVIRTVNWIEKNYHGCDTPERIRNFLRSAYENWETKYVLLGGDLTEVPIRYVYVNNYYAGGYFIPTDLYYSALNSSWNANKNKIWGEAFLDHCDYTQHLYVGRFPGREENEISIVVNKTIQYEKGENVNYNKLLLIGGKITDVASSANHCRYISERFPNYFVKDSLYERDNVYTTDSIIKRLERGYSYVYVLAHGGSTQHWSYPGYINRHHIDKLNSGSLFFANVISCYVHWIETDCLSRRFMLNPTAAVAYLGSTRVGWAGQEKDFNYIFYEGIFEKGYKTGEAVRYTKEKILPLIYSDGQERDCNYRDVLLSYLLYGDPELHLWNNYPDTFIVEMPCIVGLGEDTIKIKVKNRSRQVGIDSALVCLSNEKIYGRGFTDSQGRINFTIRRNIAGNLKVVVSKRGFIPYENYIYINPNRPYVKYKSHIIDGDGIIEAGEEITLSLTIKNTGTATAGPVITKISTDNPNVIMIDSIKNYGDISVGDCKTQDYRLKINKSSDMGKTLFKVYMIYPPYSSVDTFSVIIHKPELIHYSHRVSGRDTISISLKIKNNGNGNAYRCKTTLSVITTGVNIIDSTEELGDLEFSKIYEYKNCFIITNTYQDEIKVVLKLEDSVENKWVDTFAIKIPTNVEPPTEFFTISGPNHIIIGWKGVPFAYGYNIYRMPDSILLNKEIIKENLMWQDSVDKNYKFYYYSITSIDSNLSESKFSEIIKGKTNPKMKYGWPRYGLIRGKSVFKAPVMVADLSPERFGLEIIANSIEDEGRIYVWHYNGDGVIHSTGVFADDLGPSWNSPAIGDVDGDGKLEIVRIQSWRTNPKLYVFRKDGSLLSGFPVQLTGDNGTFSSPTLQDLDGDRKLEIIAAGCFSGKVYVFKYNGTGFLNPDGFFAQRATAALTYAAPSVADINRDGRLEIIIGSADNLYAWKPDGSLVNGWPIRIAGSPSNCAIGDIDLVYPGLEIVVATDRGKLYVFHSDGSLMHNWPKEISTGSWDLLSSPAIGDIDNDGELEITICVQNALKIWKKEDSLMITLPMMNASPMSGPIIADVDGDDTCEVIFTTLIEGDIYAIKKDGSIAYGFPIRGNGAVHSTPAIADIDNDNNNEIILGTYESAIKIWEVKGNKVEWGCFAHDRWHTGLYGFKPPDKPAVEEIANKPSVFKLYQCTPNPFRNTTTIKYQIPKKVFVKLSIYDVSGRLIYSLVEKEQNPGVYEIKFDAKKLPSGLYFLMLNTPEYKNSQKIIILK